MSKTNKKAYALQNTQPSSNKQVLFILIILQFLCLIQGCDFDKTSSGQVKEKDTKSSPQFLFLRQYINSKRYYTPNAKQHSELRYIALDTSMRNKVSFDYYVGEISAAPTTYHLQKGDSVFLSDVLLIINDSIGCYQWGQNKYCFREIIKDYKDDFWESEEVWEFWLYIDYYSEDFINGTLNFVKIYYDPKILFIIKEEGFSYYISPPPPACECPQGYFQNIAVADTIQIYSVNVTSEND